MDVSIIIVNYNTKNLVQECIKSIYDKTKDIEFEIILVDNASIDGSKELFTNYSNSIIYIYNNENVGFGTANNIGAKTASGKYLFLLNSDTLIVENSIKIFYDYMEANLDIKACGGNIINSNYQNSLIGGNFPSLQTDFLGIGFYKFFKSYFRFKFSVGQTISDLKNQEIEYIIGADIFIRKEVFDIMNGFDCDFFMYYEEVDLFKRMSKMKYKSIIIPNTSIIHLEGKSSSGLVSVNKYKMKYRSKMLYYRKHYSSVYVLFAKAIEFVTILTHPHCYKKYYFRILKECLKG